MIKVNKNNQKGITLVALIITIIIMMILVSVTVDVAFDGGLFDKAKEAARKTEEQSMYEQILMGMQLEDGEINIEKTLGELQKTLTGYKINIVESGTNYKVITVEGKNGTYTYTITDEEISIGNNKPQSNAFNWYEKFGLNVDPNAEYIYSIYTMKFTETGWIELSQNGQALGNMDAKEITTNKLEFPFTLGSDTYNTTLTMNGNGVDIDAILDGVTTVTYVKTLPAVGLTYGKLYIGSLYVKNSTSSELEVAAKFKIAFSEKYNKAFIIGETVGNDSIDSIYVNYTYDESTQKLLLLQQNVNNWTLELSKDGQKITGNFEESSIDLSGRLDLSLSNQGPIIDTAKVNSEIDIYNGWYYNANLNEFIYVLVGPSSIDGINLAYIYCNYKTANKNGGFTAKQVLDSAMTELGITIIDATHLSKDGYTYTLLENLEI